MLNKTTQTPILGLRMYEEIEYDPNIHRPSKMIQDQKGVRLVKHIVLRRIDPKVDFSTHVQKNIQEVLDAHVDAAPLGHQGALTMMQAMILALAQKAVAGNLPAAKLLMEWYAHGVATPVGGLPSNQTNIQNNFSIDPVTAQMLRGLGAEIEVV